MKDVEDSMVACSSKAFGAHCRPVCCDGGLSWKMKWMVYTQGCSPCCIDIWDQQDGGHITTVYGSGNFLVWRQELKIWFQLRDSAGRDMWLK